MDKIVYYRNVTVSLSLESEKASKICEICQQRVTCFSKMESEGCRYPSVPESYRLHVDIFRVSLIKLGYIILRIPLKWWVIFLQSWTSTGHSSNSTGSSVTNCRFSPRGLLDVLTRTKHVDTNHGFGIKENCGVMLAIMWDCKIPFFRSMNVHNIT